MTKQQAFVLYLNEQAAWRTRKAAEDLEDLHNPRSAMALSMFARFVSSLPEDDSDLALLLNRLFFGKDGKILAGDQVSDAVIRYGFDDAPKGSREFLQKLSIYALRDQEHFRE